jgi:hypothetical protein
MTVLKFHSRRSPEPDDGPVRAGPDAPAEAEVRVPEGSPRRRFAWIGTALSVLIFGVSLAVLWHLGSQMDPAEVRAAFTAASARQIGLAVLFTAVSYLLLTGYDALALRQLQIRTIPLRTTALASFTSYAVSFNLGFPLLTAGTVRYWIYAPRGLSAGKVASLTVVAGLTFLLGMATVLGFSLLRQADEIAVLTYTSRSLSQLMGLVAVLVVTGYLVWVSVKRRSVRFKGWRLELPGFRLSLAQMIIGAGDVCAAAAVLYVLLPPGHGIGYETFLGLYVFAALLGVASHAPGGLGVFEATILLALPSLPREQVLGALLLFRICYYLLPFLLALAALGAYEILNRLASARAAMRPEDE